MKILIAEDDPISRELLKKMLEDCGHEVAVAENGRQAWELFCRKEAKLIIADWSMPEMNGITLCRKIHDSKDAGYVYFIFLTGKDKKENIIEGLNAGADDYILKPFDREELDVRVRVGGRILRLERELNEKNERLLILNKKLEHIALIDTLLEIGTRRAFYDSIKKMHKHSSRYMQNYGIIMCDVDNFKSYNDTYGHLEGDRVLKKVADTLKNSLRASDTIFRFGGEEIVLLMPGQDLRGTTTAAEKLRKAVESLHIEHKGCSKGILTASFGVAYFESSDNNNGWEIILERADEALYIAKAKGRNRVALPSLVF